MKPSRNICTEFFNKILEKLIPILGTFITWTCYQVPRRYLRKFFSFFGFLWFDVFGIRKKVLIDNLNIAYPEKSSEEKLKIARQSVYQLAANMADFFVIPKINEEWVKKNVVYEGVENIQNALAQGKGVYVLSLHMGNGDLAGTLIQLQKFPLYLITKFFKNKLANDFWFSIRGAKGVQYIEPHGEKTPFQILKALKTNSLVVFVLDQYMGKPFGIETTFFGKKTGTAQGLALFYLKTKSPVVPVYCYEGKDGKAHLVYEPELKLEPFISEDKDETRRRLTQYFCDVTEKIIRKHPEQWMWVHRRWKNFND